MNSLGPMGLRRPAFTLIELLVTLTVISVLVAIVLPAIQQAREASRRLQCRNNLKQIGIAINSYIQFHTMYPPGYVYNPTSGAPFMGWSWETMLLPMLDQTPLSNSISSQVDQGLPSAGWALSKSELASFRCPSDVGDSLISSVDIPGVNSSTGQPGATTTSTISFGRSNYFGVAGYWNNAGTMTGLNASGTAGIVTMKTFRGTFGENSSTLPAQIRDGSSNTIVVGERYSPVASAAMTATTDTTNTSAPAAGGDCPKSSGSESTTTTSASGPEPSGTTGDGIWMAAVSRANSTSGAVVTGQAYVLGDTAASGVPATAVAQNGHNGQYQRGSTTGFGSAHVGGAFYLLGDGSVRFINDSIDITTYRSLGAVNDGAPIFDF